MTRPRKSFPYHYTPSVSRPEEPFDFDAEKAKLKKMTDAELREYGRAYSKLAKLHTLKEPRWHDLYRLELATHEYRSRQK